jgi:hypothetical protein
MFAGGAASRRERARPAKEATPAAPLRPPAAGSRLLFLVNRSPADWSGAPVHWNTPGHGVAAEARA